jgi:hypothetical protein
MCSLCATSAAGEDATFTIADAAVELEGAYVRAAWAHGSRRCAHCNRHCAVMHCAVLHLRLQGLSPTHDIDSELQYTSNCVHRIDRTSGASCCDPLVPRTLPRVLPPQLRADVREELGRAVVGSGRVARTLDLSDTLDHFCACHVSVNVALR